jgi:hypothetical protein
MKLNRGSWGCVLDFPVFGGRTITSTRSGRSKAANQDFPLVAAVPAGMTCTGAVGALKSVCAVKCVNLVGFFVEQYSFNKRLRKSDILSAADLLPEPRLPFIGTAGKTSLNISGAGSRASKGGHCDLVSSTLLMHRRTY